MRADIAILLPVLGRPEHTRRWLRYAATAGLDCAIIIADGSSEADFLTVTEELSALRLDKVRHERHPASGGRREFFARIARALAGVTAPFCALSANDDFPLPDGLDAGTVELSRRPELSSCGGSSTGVLLDSARPRFQSSPAPREILATGALGRMTGMLADYSPTWYDLHRTAALRSAFERLAASSIMDANLGELSQALFCAANGGAGRLARPMVVREIDAPGSDSGAVAASAKDLLDEMCAPAWTASFDAFVGAGAALAAELDGVEPKDAERALRAAYAAYARKVLVPTPNGRRTLTAVKAAVKRHLRPDHWAKLKSGARAFAAAATADGSAGAEPVASFLATWKPRD